MKGTTTMLAIRVRRAEGELAKVTSYLAQLQSGGDTEEGSGDTVEEAVGNFICLNQEKFDIEVRTDP